MISTIETGFARVSEQPGDVSIGSMAVAAARARACLRVLAGARALAQKVE
jgi:hypothetical protein